MTPTRLLAVAAGLALSLTAPACNKDKKDEGSTAGQAKPQPAAPAALPSAAPAALPSAAPAATPTADPAAAVAAAAALAPAAAPAAAPASAATGCAKLVAQASRQLDTGKISCIEGAMEDKGFEFDSKACNGLENAWPVGMGDFKVLWASCQSEQKFDDTACNAVLSKCF